jgi:hypothetical protein
MKNEAMGRAAYEAYCEAMREWLPFPPDWEKQAKSVKLAWIAAALAARALPQ